MSGPAVSLLRPYALATLYVAAAFAVRLLAAPALGERSPLIVFTLAVLLAAARHGVGPGLLATLLSTFVGGWAFIGAPYGFTGLPLDAWANVSVFLASSAGILVIADRLRRSREDASRAIEALREERARLGGILESTTDSVFLLDRDWRFVFLNQRAKAQIADGRDLLGQNVWEAFPGVAESKFGQAFRAAVEQGRSTQVTAYYDFLQAWFEAHAFPSPEGLTVFFRDVTEARRAVTALAESEARVRAVFENASVGMARVSFEGARFLEVNDTLCEVLGRGREELLATPWTAITHPDDLDLDLVPFRRMAQGEIDRYAVEKRFIHADGRHVWARLSLSLVRDAAGRPDFEICIVEDISARKAAEEELRGARDLLQSTMDGALDPVFVKDRQGHFVFVNTRLSQLFGQPREAIIGRTDADFWPPEFAKRVMEADRGVMEAGVPRAVEEAVPENGELRVLQSQIVPWRDAEGRVIGVIGFGRDITELKQNAAALAASEQRLTVAAEAAGFGTYDWDVLEDRHVWSPETHRIFGLPRDGPVNMTTVRDRIHPDDRDRADLEVARAFAEGGDIATEYRLMQPDGSVRHIVNRARVTYSGKGDARRPIRLIGAVRDATEQREAEAAIRESEQRYRTLIEAIDAGFSLVELRFDDAMRPLDYVFVEVNPAFERQTGLVGAIGRTARELIPGLEKHWFETYGQIALTGKSIRFENHSEAMGRWFDVHAVPVGNQAPYRVGILFNDVTERRRAEEEVRRLNRNLEALVEERTRRLEETIAELDAFAYTISHDLRAPLRGIEGFARILNEDYAPEMGPEAQRYARRIAAAAERMDLLIQDLLAYSRLSRADLERKRVDLDAVVEGVLQDHRAVLDAAGAEVLVERPLPAVLGTRAVLGQIVGNLITNAAKFVAAGTAPRLRIYAEPRDGMQRLWVEDNGIGIEEEYRERIFNVFERLHGQEHYSGTGIGLAIVRKGAERLGGRAGVEPGPDGGSRFWVDLPAASAEGAA